ncbi:MAG: prephenate dehydrogenase/arogenate dehydrogenase family protein [Lachnospirales bacterium]
MEINKIGIVGLGLMGGSLAKAIKKHTNINIVAYNLTEDDLIEAKNDKIIEDYVFGDFEQINKEFFSNCNIVFFATPINLIINEIKFIQPFLPKDCLISDLGSTKNSISKEMEKINANYIGGHPMTGSEKVGYQNSLDYLFENAYFILTPLPYIEKKSLESLKSLIKTIGAIPLVMDGKSHDKAVSGISHSPHLIASALVNTVKDLDSELNMHKLAAGGFKDITRIASSNPNIWTAISMDNRKEIICFLENFNNTINEVITTLKNKEEKNIYNFFESSQTYRNTFENRKSTKYTLSVNIEDKPGVLATMCSVLSFNEISIKNISIVNNREYDEGVLKIQFKDEDDLVRAKELLINMSFNVI